MKLQGPFLEGLLGRCGGREDSSRSWCPPGGGYTVQGEAGLDSGEEGGHQACTILQSIWMGGALTAPPVLPGCCLDDQPCLMQEEEKEILGAGYGGGRDLGGSMGEGCLDPGR